VVSGGGRGSHDQSEDSALYGGPYARKDSCVPCGSLSDDLGTPGCYRCNPGGCAPNPLVMALCGSLLGRPRLIGYFVEAGAMEPRYQGANLGPILGGEPSARHWAPPVQAWRCRRPPGRWSRSFSTVAEKFHVASRRPTAICDRRRADVSLHRVSLCFAHFARVAAHLKSRCVCACHQWLDRRIRRSA
jgi:hypothetical protein